ncbi:fimbrial protein [Chromobacterium haemolyticum]|nr:fimbrial protein [Chromobacterium haemolyticum]
MLNRRLPRLLLMAALAMLPALSHALACKEGGRNGSAMITRDIGSTIKVPVTLPDGREIWHSEDRTVNVTCYKDNSVSMREQVYFYPNPRNNNNAKGVKFGVVYNGRTYWGVNASDRIPTGYYIDECNLGGNYDRCKEVNFSLTFQVVIAKQGTIPTSGIGMSEFQVLQFDGELGINNKENSNLVYKVVGLGKITPIQCAVEVRLDPASNTLDFGRIVRSVKGLVPAVPRKDFRLNLVKTCDDPVKINGYFTGKNGLTDTYTATLVKKKDSSDSGLGLQLFFSDGRQLRFGQSEFLADFSFGDRQKTVPMYGTIVPTNMGKVEEGPFQGMINIDLDYI